MKEEVFRKKSLDKLKSPESLDECIKVTNPGVWLLLAAVILLLVGACVWGIFGHIDSRVPVTVQVRSGEVSCLVKEENIVGIAAGMTVRFEGQEAAIGAIGEKGADGYLCTLEGGSSLPDGYYEGNIIVKSYRPVSFIFN